MSPVSKALLIEVMGRYNGLNNGDIVFSVREAALIGITPSHAGRAFKELINRGFLRVTRDSAFNVKARLARTWEITAEPVGGRPATKDFMRWPNGEAAAKDAISAVLPTPAW